MTRRHNTSESAKTEPAQAARRNRAAAAGEDVLKQGSGALARAGFADATLILRWREIAGTGVARVAEPVKLSEGPEGATLTLRCIPGAAMLLQHETRALIGRLNGHLGSGRITRLKLETGDIATPPAVPTHPSAGHNRAIGEGEPQHLPDALERLATRRRLRARTAPHRNN